MGSPLPKLPARPLKLDCSPRNKALEARASSRLQYGSWHGSDLEVQRTLTLRREGRFTGLGTESLRSGSVDAVRGFCGQGHRQGPGRESRR